MTHNEIIAYLLAAIVLGVPIGWWHHIQNRYTIMFDNYSCNVPLFALLSDLRRTQRAYFKANHGSIEKSHLFKKSKALEKQLDDFLREMELAETNKDIQAKLF